MREVLAHTASAAAVANAAGGSAAMLRRLMGSMAEAVREVDDSAGKIAGEIGNVTVQCEHLTETAGSLARDAASASTSLDQAAGRTQRMLDLSERLMAGTAQAGVPTVDTKFIEAALNTAAAIEKIFAASIAAGDITLDALFDKRLVPVPGTDPVQYTTRYIDFVERVLPPIHDPIMQLDPRMVFCTVSDHNLLIPTHNPQYRQKHGPDPAWNAAHGRNRRKYEDKTAKAAISHTQHGRRQICADEGRVGADRCRRQALGRAAGLLSGVRQRKMFFSEEKNQKTFASALVDRYRIWPDRQSLPN